jgi:hypothetical protein
MDLLDSTGNMFSGWKDTVKDEVVFALKDYIRKKIDELTERVPLLEAAYDISKGYLDKQIEKGKNLGSEIASIGKTLGSSLKRLTNIKSEAKSLYDKRKGLGKKLTSARKTLATTPKKIKENFWKWVKKRTKWRWKWVLRLKGRMVGNPVYTRNTQNVSNIQGEYNKVNNSFSLKTIQISKTEKEVAINEQDLKRKEIELEQNKSIITKQIPLVEEALDKIISAKDKITMLRKLKDKITEINFSGVKDYISTIKEIIPGPEIFTPDVLMEMLLMRYRTLNLTDEEMYLVEKEHYPWTHNPAHLCQVYLPVKEGSTQEYFAGKYELNQYMEDTLGGNFIYLNGQAVPK